MPLVSVIIPAYNYGRFLADAIESVLAQTFKDYELIVVDDGSTDNTQEVVKPYQGRMHYQRNQNRGLSATRNFGVSLAKGKYLAFLDADDEWLPNKLAVQVPVLDDHPDAALVMSRFTLMDGSRQALPGLKPLNKPGETFREIVYHGTACPSSFLVRRECFEALGGFDESIATMEDFDIGLRLAARYRVIQLEEPLGRYRIHGPSLSTAPDKVYPSYVSIFERLLAERETSLPKNLVRERLAHYRYFLAKHRLSQARSDEGLRLMRGALLVWPFFGWSLDKSVSPVWRALNLFKVYGVVLVSHMHPGALARGKESTSG